MEQAVKVINEYIEFKEKMEYKKELGYSLSYSDIQKLNELREEALKAKDKIKEENKEIKKLIKSIK